MELAGERRRLCLTLGALAEIEGGLGVRGIEALAVRLGALSATDLVVVLGALLRGGGEAAFAERLALEPVDPAQAARAVADAFRAVV